MTTYDITLLPGDGIGKVVLDQSVRVLEAAGFKANYHVGDIGWEYWCKEGNPLPDRTIELLKKFPISLFGAITSKPKDQATAELDPAITGKPVYYSPIVKLRQLFDLDVCVRPCRSIPGNPLNFVQRTADGGIREPKINAVVFRQNTEGLYGGVEWTNPPDNVYQALNSHPKFKNFASCPREDLAVSTRIFTRKYTHRIVRAAFEYADKFGYKSVTVCEKPNVIRETSGMMREEAKKIKQDFPHIALYETNIDAQVMWLTKNPDTTDVIVCGNMFGDIVSDGFAGLIGGLGFACSANIGPKVAVFEPTHGSAPKYADYETSIVNPIAMIMSGVMMLDHLGEKDMGEKITRAVEAVVAEGKVQTYDMKMLKGSAGVIEQGAASTQQLADAVIAKLAELAA